MKVIQKESGCTGCMACVVACQDRNRLKPIVTLCVVEIGDSSPPLWRGCHQCDEPECLEACPFGAIFRRVADGVIIVDRDRCRGCRLCVKACSFGVMAFQEEHRTAVKCDLCGADAPACVGACPYQVLDME